MPSVTDHSDDFDREWALPQRLRAWRSRSASLYVPEEIRRRAEAWLASEMIPWRAQFQPKVTRPPEFPLK
jgi:hypothetical protein